MLGTGNLDLIALLIKQFDLRTLYVSTRTRFGRNYNQGGQPGNLIHLTGYRNGFLDVLKAHRSGILGNNESSQWIPAGNTLSSLYCGPIINKYGCPIRDLVTLTLWTINFIIQYMT